MSRPKIFHNITANINDYKTLFTINNDYIEGTVTAIPINQNYYIERQDIRIKKQLILAKIIIRHC